MKTEQRKKKSKEFLKLNDRLKIMLNKYYLQCLLCILSINRVIHNLYEFNIHGTYQFISWIHVSTKIYYSKYEVNRYTHHHNLHKNNDFVKRHKMYCFFFCSLIQLFKINIHLKRPSMYRLNFRTSRTDRRISFF